jgi:hypothetical protein
VFVFPTTLGLAEAAHNHGIPYAALHQKCIGHFDRLAAVLLENAGVTPRASSETQGCNLRTDFA